jgi:hypothetical protein
MRESPFEGNFTCKRPLRIAAATTAAITGASHTKVNEAALMPVAPNAKLLKYALQIAVRDFNHPYTTA